VYSITKKRKNISPGKIAWKKFRKNTSAMLALLWIGINVLISVLGYLITPDSAPYANTQYLELAALRPGTKIEFLWVRKNNKEERTSILSKMIYGEQSNYQKLPISQFSIIDHSVIAQSYTGYDQIEGEKRVFDVSDIIFPVDTVIYDSNKATIKTLENETITVQLNEIHEKIRSNHIKKQTFWLGTDRYGRDLVSQVIIGARISLSVGFIAIFIALAAGIFMGSLAGFFRGRTDNVIMWLINVVWSIPTLLLVIAITFALGKGFWQIFVAVGLTMWVDVARVVRGQIISLRENEYIEAAKALGLPGLRIIRRHLLPNIIGPVVVISAANFASAILIEAGLSFLGIGVQPPMPSWGNMIRENYGFIILDKAFLAIIPGLCIMFLVMAFMLVGNGLRDALDKTNTNY
jgi:peptide/nickel transport system permease protein